MCRQEGVLKSEGVDQSDDLSSLPVMTVFSLEYAGLKLHYWNSPEKHFIWSFNVSSLID